MLFDQQKPSGKLVEAIDEIECQNLRLVDVMSSVQETTAHIKMSENYAKFMIRSNLKDGKSHSSHFN
jgi:hypothetical protein